MIAKLMTVAFVVGCVESIVSKSGDIKEKREDSLPQQSIERGFTYGEEGQLGHHGSAGFAEGYGYYGGNYDASKYYGYEELHHSHEHKEHDPAYYKALALKGLLIPLAGVALLGAAAAFVTNPILLQLGVISSTYGRKKRDTRSQLGGKHQDIQLLERFIAQVPQEEIQFQEEKLFANYLTCSGVTTDHACLERLACELQSTKGASMSVETDVMAVITNEILSNKFISDKIKSRIAEAVRRGKTSASCSVYKCIQLAQLMENARKTSQRKHNAI